MPDHELSAEEAFQLLDEIFGGSNPTRRSRRYVLEFRDGQPTFRRANFAPLHQHDEIEGMLDQIIAEKFGDDGDDDDDGDDIVPQKLAKAFPGSSFEPACCGSQ